MACGIFRHVVRYLLAVIKVIEVHDLLQSSKREHNRVSQARIAYKVVGAMSDPTTVAYVFLISVLSPQWTETEITEPPHLG